MNLKSGKGIWEALEGRKGRGKCCNYNFKKYRKNV